MRFLGVSETCDLGSLYLRLMAEGHEVRVAVSEPLAAGTMAGLVPRTDDWRGELEWIREAGSGGVILFEAVGFGTVQDELRRDGYNVIGGSALGDRLENDRAFGQEVLHEIGLNPTPCVEFHHASDAVENLENRPRRTVFKMSASAGETFVGEYADAADMKAFLNSWQDEGDKRFILMDFVDGVETGVGAYFNGNRFLQPACLDWEHKRFFAGDMGELTGEMGTVATYQLSGKLFRTCLEPLEPLLRDAGHVGYVNLNAIINETGIWPLEFTCRFGYPGFAILEVLQACGWAQLFAWMIGRAGSFAARSGFAACVVLTTPPFPWSRKELAVPVGMPVLTGDVPARHLHWGEVGMANGQLVTSGLYGWTAVVTGLGPSVEQAAEQAYRYARQVRCPNLRYRLDIGARMPDALARIAGWGWLQD